MMQPDAALCQIYGTKLAESPFMDAAAAILGTGGMIADQQHSKRQRREAIAAELMAREMEAARQMPVRRSLRAPGGIAPDRTRYQDLGQLGNFSDLDPGFAAQLFEKGGALVEQLGRLGAGTAAKGLGVGAAAAGRGLQGLGQGLGQGFGATGRLARAAGPEMMAGLTPGASSRFGGIVGQAGKALEQGGQAAAGAGQRLVDSAPQVARKMPVPGQSKPLISGVNKAKMLGAAGVIGAGYAGMKGLGAVRDYMSVPAGHHHVGYLRSNVNEFGY
jgi:hypothetical protein